MNPANANSIRPLRKIKPSSPRNSRNIVVDQPFLNCDKIYPIQQKKTLHFIDALKNDDNVISIIIFGSSVTDQCHCGSDLDIFVELRQNAKLAIPSLDFVYDLWTNFTADEHLNEEIKKRGVLVYERNIAS